MSPQIDGRAKLSLRRRLLSEERLVEAVRRTVFTDHTITPRMDHVTRTAEQLGISSRVVYDVVPNLYVASALARIPQTTSERRPVTELRSLATGDPGCDLGLVAAQQIYADAVELDGLDMALSIARFHHAARAFLPAGHAWSKPAELYGDATAVPDVGPGDLLKLHWALRARLGALLATRRGEYFWCSLELTDDRAEELLTIVDQAAEIGADTIAVQASALQVLHHAERGNATDMRHRLTRLDRLLATSLRTGSDGNGALLAHTPTGYEARCRIIRALLHIGNLRHQPIQTRLSQWAIDEAARRVTELRTDSAAADPLVSEWIAVISERFDMHHGIRRYARPDLSADHWLIARLPRRALNAAQEAADADDPINRAVARTLWCTVADQSEPWARVEARARHARFEVQIGNTDLASVIAQAGLAAFELTNGQYEMDADDHNNIDELTTLASAAAVRTLPDGEADQHIYRSAANLATELNDALQKAPRLTAQQSQSLTALLDAALAVLEVLELSAPADRPPVSRDAPTSERKPTVATDKADTAPYRPK